MLPKPSRSRLPAIATARAETPDVANNGRQRQTKKDEAIRKKLEQELSKKRTGTTRVRQTRKIAGTVSALRPAQALTVKENMLVIEASQLMAAKRSDCVLVVDEDDHLSGIFTAKDLAYRVVAESLDARHTPVSQIMTPGPMCVTADTSATDALNLMVTRGFRHLPVCNEEGDIFGLLDITKCLYEALDKMERAFGSSRKLYDALEGVEREWSGSPVQLAQYMETLRDKMSCPDLNTVLDGSLPAQVSVKVNVRDVARLMKEYHTTAVLVSDREGLAGIFTTKDVVLRVIAAGLNPENCSVVRVMTPHPDTASPHMSIIDALRQMHDGHYLNLPVLEDGRVVGIVDVLKLTYATLEQINSIQGADGEGPMWSRFWDSFGATEHAENESQLSDPTSHHHHLPASQHPMEAISPEPSISFSQLHGFPEISPNESASMVAHNEDNRSANSSHNTRPTKTSGNGGDGSFAFKFTTKGGKTHRIASTPKHSQLLELVRQKVLSEHVPSAAEGEWLSISYLDDEDDEVLITSDADVQDAVRLARKLGQDRVKLFAHDSTSVTAHTAEPPAPVISLSPPSDVSSKTMRQEDDDTSSMTSRSTRKRSSKRKSSRRNESEEPEEYESNTGFPQELILPASIAFLGVVILGVFAFSRVSPKHR
ncbi:hypothetical protein PHYBLDRAFT_22406 [Phycomyces blakesleeanus NRRL 1555(-)]|uniref:CBS domain-containing protein n=1 Tax=Phycomyces blakesleeanus (strain ATCC 8743b / DSM 1359 / FGSC 10004 / NBRC 33097 / NRRL 1555) TaxID=763407 RepID=A0A162WML8_PHYB8|nr:hypothetical protein PHYBLDRAFT_22406 [Phycomyces blakesleeanus NRRL 1555(-)]OAD69095.1 hypothetical protein PHYBLDRAFT_22406 [Phycomyces blakesleeanus NRRL 1555(-)]|eukprot:XP_018287135.1 hypothetical protein PHYBLDRAFT_22406 [Phycomyces blakesleeanus NRRL 1555(-)]